MKTKQDKKFSYNWYRSITIPAGTPVVPASNLPGDRYFAELDPAEYGEDVISWSGTYGFIYEAEEVEQ